MSAFDRTLPECEEGFVCEKVPREPGTKLPEWSICKKIQRKDPIGNIWGYYMGGIVKKDALKSIFYIMILMAKIITVSSHLDCYDCGHSLQICCRYADGSKGCSFMEDCPTGKEL